MTYSRLRTLLDKFYAGETDVEIQRELQEYFATATDIPAEFRVDAELFGALSAPSEVPADLERRIVAATVGRPRRRRWSITTIAAAAAVLLLIVTAPPKTDNYREVTDLAEAEVLTLQVARTLQKNIDKLEILNNLPL